MALFNPQAQQIAPEAPTSGGGRLVGLEAAASGLASIFDARQEAQVTQQNQAIRNNLTDGLAEVRALIDQGDIDRAMVTARNIQSAYVRSGGEWNEEVRSLAVTMTGIPSNQFGMTQADRDRQSRMELRSELLQDNTFLGLMANASRANPDLSEDELFNAAFNSYASLQESQAVLEQVSTMSQTAFVTEGRPAMEEVIETFRTSALGGFIDTFSEGGVIDLDNLTEAKLLWQNQKGTVLSRPANVTDAQWQGIQDRIDSIDAVFTNLESVLSEEGRQERVNSFIKQVASNGDLSYKTTEEIILAMLGSKDILTMMSTAQGGMPFELNTELQLALAGQLELRLDEQARQAISNTLPTRPDGIVDPNGFMTLEDIPTSIREEVESVDNDGLLDSIRTTGGFIANVNPQSLNDPAVAAAYSNQGYRLGVWMMSTSERPLAPAVLDQIGINENLGRKLDVIDAVGTDDGFEQAARVALRTGLTTQIALQTRYLESLGSRGPFMKFGGTYQQDEGTFTLENTDGVRTLLFSTGAVQARFGVDDPVTAFRQANPNYFNENGYLIIPSERQPNEPAWVDRVRYSLPEEFRNYVNYSNSLVRLTAARDSLAVDTPDQGEIDINPVLELSPNSPVPSALSGDQEFVGALNTTANNLGLPANWLLGLINFESGGRTDIVAPNTNATGLIQFMPATAEGLGTSVEELARMTPAQQMDYVERFLRPYADRIKRPEDLYMAVFFPHAIGKPDDFVLGSDGTGPSPEKIAEQNPVFNKDGDDQVTAGDVRREIMANPRFTDYLNGTAPSEIQVSTLPPQETATAAPARPQTSMPTGMAAPATQVVDQTTASPAVTAAPVVDTSTPFLGRPQNPEQPVQVPQEIVDSLAGVAEGVKDIAGGSSDTASLIDRMVSEGRGEGISYRDITKLIQDMQALPRTPKRQEVLADLYEIRDNLTNR